MGSSIAFGAKEHLEGNRSLSDINES